MPSKYSFYKEKVTDKVWWLDNYDQMGEYVFSFDKKKTFNLFSDYPDKLSVEEWFIFNAENAYWRDYFEYRNALYEVNHSEEIEQYREKNMENQG